MQKNIIPYVLLIISIFIGFTFWEKILLNTTNLEWAYGIYQKENYHPQNDTLRFVAFIGFSLLVYLLSYIICNKKKIYKFKEIIFYNEPYKHDISYKYFYFIISIILIEFLSLDFLSIHSSLDQLHEGVFLTPSINLLTNSNWWSSSFVEYGIGNFDAALVWSFLKFKSIGSAKLIKFLLLFLNKILLVLISFKISTLLFDKSKIKVIYFIVLSLFAITLIDYTELDATAFAPRSFMLLFFLYYILYILTSDQYFFKLFFLGLFSVISIFWYLDIGIFINIIIIFVSLFLLIKLDIKGFITVNVSILFFWCIFLLFIPKGELNFILLNIKYMITNSDYINGLIYPTPFLSGNSRATKALLLIILNGVLLTNIVLNKRYTINNNLKIFLSTLYLTSLLLFKQAMLRSDTPHIKVASGMTYFIFIIMFLYLIFDLYLKNEKIINQKIKYFYYKKTLIFLSLCAITYSIYITQNFNFINIFNFKKNIYEYVKRDNIKFINSDYADLISYYLKISKGEGCAQIITNEAAIPYLLNKPSCTRYFTNWYLAENKHQQTFINELKNTKPKIILYDSKLDTYNDKKLKMPLVINFINKNYKIHSVFNHWTFVEIN